MSGIHHMKQLLALKCSNGQENQDEINKRMEQVVSEATCKDSSLIYFKAETDLFYVLDSRQDR